MVVEAFEGAVVWLATAEPKQNELAQARQHLAMSVEDLDCYYRLP